jgi:hypothetical protein
MASELSHRRSNMTGARNVREPQTSLERRLLAYAAAGAGAIGCIPSAHADIVYTPAHSVVTNAGLRLDLNNDGITDFNITNIGSFFARNLQVNGNQNPGAGILREPDFEALPLSSGAPIGLDSPEPFARVQSRSLKMARAYCSCQNSEGYYVVGVWANTTDKYLGVRFEFNGQAHFGWVRLSVKASPYGKPTIQVTLTGYAYETTPNTSINAGDQGPDSKLRGALLDNKTIRPVRAESSGSLGQLSLGANGIDVWRRTTG